MVVSGRNQDTTMMSINSINLNEYISSGNVDRDHPIEYEEILTQPELDALQAEFSRIKDSCCYLDHAGATLYASSQIDSFHSELQSNLFSNPHSRNPSSTITTDAIDYIRLRILHHFGTNPDDYSVIFTSGATSAMKLLAESFRFNGGLFAYLEESHTSVIGMRELVNLSGIPTQPRPRGQRQRSSFNNKSGLVPPKLDPDVEPSDGDTYGREGLGSNGDGDSDINHVGPSEKMKRNREPDSILDNSPGSSKVYCLANTTLEKLMESQDDILGKSSGSSSSSSSSMNNGGGGSSNQHGGDRDDDDDDKETLMKSDHNALFVYPAQCNFSGYKYPLEWIPKIQNGGLDRIADFDQFYLDEIETFETHDGTHDADAATSMAKTAETQMYSGNNKETTNATAANTPPKNNKRMRNASEEASHWKKCETKDEQDGNNSEDEGAAWSKSNLNVKKMNTRTRKEYSWFVLVDAASYVGSNGLDLSLHPADFVAVSFYKMFGFPTGLGALLVRNKSAHVLEKRYFGGGTVNIALPSSMFHVKRGKLHERFEDGTISFLNILALRAGFDTMTKLGRSLDTISTRTFRLAKYLYDWLSSMKYPNGQPVARIYSDTKYETKDRQGPVVTFNLLRADGSVIGYSELEQIAYLHDVHLRYGCFCNPGACRRHLGLGHDEVIKHYEAGHVCGDMRDLIDGKPTGAVRASLGYMTRKSDVEMLIRLIYDCWIRPFQIHVSTFERPKTTNRDNDKLTRQPSSENVDVDHLAGYSNLHTANNNNEGESYSPDTLGKSKSSYHHQYERNQSSSRDVATSSPQQHSITSTRSRTQFHQSHKDHHRPQPRTSNDHGRTRVAEPKLQDSMSDSDVHAVEEARKLLRIFLYPIKSCAPFEVSKGWPIGPRGLLYDREWLIMNSSGVPLTQKREPRLTQLKPRIDVNGRRLVLRMKGNPEMTVPLDTDQLRLREEQQMEKIEICNTKVCGDIVSGLNCGAEVNNWLSTAFDRPGLKLIRIAAEFQRSPRTSSDELSLANQSQFLLLTTGSLRYMAEQLREKGICFSSSDYEDDDEDGDDDELQMHTSKKANLLTLIQENRKAKAETETTRTSLKKLMASEPELLEHAHENGSLNQIYPVKGPRLAPAEGSNQSPDRDRDWESELQLAKTMENLIHRFRTNFVISCSLPFQEEDWEQVNIGEVPFKSGGRCMRCATICMNPVNGERSSEPLLTLSAVRGGRPTFGIHLYSNYAHEREQHRRHEDDERDGNFFTSHSISNLNNDSSSTTTATALDQQERQVQVTDDDTSEEQQSAWPTWPSSQYRSVQVNNTIRVVKWIENGNADGTSGSGGRPQVDLSKSQRNRKIQQHNLHKVEQDEKQNAASGSVKPEFSSFEPSSVRSRSGHHDGHDHCGPSTHTSPNPNSISKRELIESID